MKRSRFLLFILMLCLFPTDRIAAQTSPRKHHLNRKTVGLVLSGGGAKGVAHVGVIRVLEEAGIPIDYIAGTSMGSIVGGLYSVGWTVDQMDSLFQTQNWIDLLGDRVTRKTQLFTVKETADKTLLTVPIERRKLKIPTGVLSGQNVYNMLSECTIGYHDPCNYDTLPIPFACVALDLVSGRDQVMRSGVLPTSIRASMSIPGAFAAVRDQGRVLIDGGMYNNYPVDVIKAMGADLVIGVDVGGSDKEEFTSDSDSFLEMFGRILEILGQRKKQANIARTDLYIRPHLAPYSTASFTNAAIDTMLLRGENQARSQWDEILAFKKKIGGPGKTAARPNPIVDSVTVSRILLPEKKPRDAKFLIKNIIGITAGKRIKTTDIRTAIANLQGTGQFSEVTYNLLRNENAKTGTTAYDLVFNTSPRIRSSISLGLRMDTEDVASIFLNGVYAPNEMRGLILELTSRASRNSYAKLGVYYENAFLGKFGTSYMFRLGDFPVSIPGHDTYTSYFHLHQADLDIANFYYKKFNLYLGFRFNYFNNRSSLYGIGGKPAENASESIMSYRAAIRYDSFDKAYFPRKGTRFYTGYSIYTDNMVTYNEGSPFTAMAFSIEGAIPILKRLTLLPSLHTRMLFGESFAWPYLNFLGTPYSGRYMDQQLPFAGMNQTELADPVLLIAAMAGQWNITGHHHLLLKCNAAHLTPTLEQIGETDVSRSILGASLAYGYDSPFGPIEFHINYCNRNSRKLGFYLSLGKYF